MSQGTTLYTGGYLIKENEVVREDLWVKNGKFIDPETVNYTADRTVQMFRKLISPGFIDLKLNGCFGVDFSDKEHVSQEKVLEVARQVASYGITSFYPCITSVEKAAYDYLIPTLRETMAASAEAAGTAEILGIQLDGPLHNNAKKGHLKADSPISRKASQAVNLETVCQQYGSLDGIKIVSIAPEHPGAIESIIPGLTQMGIKVSLAHTSCTIEEAEAAVNAGASVIGHLFNGMPNFHHRDPSLVGVLASTELNKPIHFGLIADLVHCHPNSIAMAQKLKPQGLMLISDGVSAMGLRGEEMDTGSPVQVKDVKGQRIELRKSDSLNVGQMVYAAYEHGTDKLMGGVTPLIDAVKNVLLYTDANLLEAIAAITCRPARAMEISPKKGSLEYGADADFVTLDRNLTICATYAGGSLAYMADSEEAVHSLQPAIQMKVDAYFPM